MKIIYKFSLNCGRMGEIFGLFVEDDNVIEKLLEIKPEIYFGELLGKHSEIISDEYQIEYVSDDQQFIETFERYDLSIGYNPLDFIVDGIEVRDYLENEN